MTYTEVKKKGEKTYYYRGKSVRQGKKVNKERIYLGVNLTKQELAQKEQEADKKMLNIQEKPQNQDKKPKKQGQGSQKNQRDSKGLSAKKQENMSEWYEQVCLKAEIAEFGPVKGTMVIRPNGYAIWQAIQDYFNENSNRIIRRFIPKGEDIANFSKSDISKIERWINNYPRRILGYRTAKQMTKECFQDNRDLKLDIVAL